ncbi:hypothetical protein AnigIFM50267_009373 [Aspergillus niger]|nr:hypothetical protein AnigIFM50267_009373 [Aspergillus niger]
MARIKAWRETPRPQWIARQYRDHAQQPAVFMTLKETNPEALPVRLPQIAIQVYSTVPLSLESEEDTEDDYTALSRYLSSRRSSYPDEAMSFEIYAPQADVFACVEHQRREIRYRKNDIPGEGFFPGIAKVAPDKHNHLLQGFLLVITSYSFRDTFLPTYEAGSGPLWVNFDRCFPLKAKVDLPSRIESTSWSGFDLSTISVDRQVYSEREELVVRKCRHVDDRCRELSSLITRSHNDMEEEEEEKFDYGLNEDEGDPSLSIQPLAPQIIELLQSKADSLDHDQFDIRSASDGAVAIKTDTASLTSEPELQYIIHVAFPYEQLELELVTIAKAFTGAIIENLPEGKAVNFEFFPADQSLGATLASHRALMNYRPDIAVGALHQGTRRFPQKRHEPEVEVPSDREPYRTFFVILDRPDFLTGPGGILGVFCAYAYPTASPVASNSIELVLKDDDYLLYSVLKSFSLDTSARSISSNGAWYDEIMKRARFESIPTRFGKEKEAKIVASEAWPSITLPGVTWVNEQNRDEFATMHLPRGTGAAAADGSKGGPTPVTFGNEPPSPPYGNDSPDDISPGKDDKSAVLQYADRAIFAVIPPWAVRV